MSTDKSRPALRDAAPRRLIETELDRNVMVLAGAGAGKTHELVGRMIALLRTGRVQVGEIAAITFTRKAAGELRSRFMQRLREALPAAEGVERERLQAALRRADQCFMGTIHAFCSRLLRERPVEGRVPPDFADLEAEEEARSARQEWNRFIRARYAAEDARLLYLEEAGIMPENLYDFFRARAEVPELRLRMIDVPVPDLVSAARAVIAFMEEAASHIPHPLPKYKDDMMKVVESVLSFARNRRLEHPGEAAALLELLKSNPTTTFSCWEPHNEYAKALRNERYPELRDRVVEPVLRLWREHLYPHAASLVDEAVAAYRDRRAESGKLTFADLLLSASRMLQSSPEAREYFRARYRTILVDEFQDTDPIQAEILLYLTATDPDEQAWREIVPQPGSLFLVGDEKQSIYRFRRADVATFRFMRDRIAETGGLVLHLNTSFRSFGNLCSWINDAYPRAFREGFPTYQTDYGELFQYRSPGSDPHCVRRIVIPRVFGHNKKEIVRLEAERIAAFIRAALDGRTACNGGGDDSVLAPNASPSDFLILTRYSKSLGAYAAALENVGVPYDITGSKNLHRAEEVRALVDLLRVVLEPDNPIYYVAFLRGLCVGLADDVLYRYRTAGGSFHPGRPLPSDLDPNDAERLAAARELIDWASEAFRRMTPASVIEALLDRTGLTAYARAEPLGSSRAGNLLRLVSFARSLEDRGMHWGEIVSELESIVENGAYDLEEMTLSYGGSDAVRIMNIHQAKGLQAKVVFLADPCGTGSRAGVERHVARTGDDPHLSIRIMRQASEYQRRPVAQPVGWDEDAEEEERHSAAEEARLLYVAGTRAENLLIVSLYKPKQEEGRHGWIFPTLQGVPELESVTPSVPQVAAHGENVSRRPPVARAEQITRGRAPRYQRGTVTGAKTSDTPVVDVSPGRGRDYGTVVHTVLEDAVRGRLPRNPLPYVDALCTAAKLEAEAVRSVVALLQRFRKSAVWAEVQDSPAVYTEVPIGVFGADALPTIIQGKIDLIYRHGAGWTIIDYKTDIDAASGQLPLDLDHYAQQIRQYAECWERVTGEPVVRCALYGTAGDGGVVEIARAA